METSNILVPLLEREEPFKVRFTITTPVPMATTHVAKAKDALELIVKTFVRDGLMESATLTVDDEGTVALCDYCGDGGAIPTTDGPFCATCYHPLAGASTP